MHNYHLTPQDSMQDFEAGLRAIGYYDCVSEHQNRHRRCLLLGHSRAWTVIEGRELPIVIDYKARITIPSDRLGTPQADAIDAILRHRLSTLSGRWLVDIRTEARMQHYGGLAELVRQDIERGDLPNRLVFDRGLQTQVLPQIAALRRRIGADPTFDWRRVRVDVKV